MSDHAIVHEYATAVYEIYEPHCILHVGQTSDVLDALLDQHGVTQWAFITPYNPHPRKLSDAENAARLSELQTLTESYITYEGEGRDGGADPCPVEKGLFILGITPDEARDMGNQFEQKAILTGEIGKPVELVVLK